ncbi:MAG: hypothetical protein CM1200mP14_22960 [Gammaproteobacteria bacterium]|nr:MAG: hypothetical protein CM1200mP14_22960 [Gammaproteobacteria bacterium]
MGSCERPHWSWGYLLGLNLWGRDRVAEGAELFIGLGQRPDYGPFYVSRVDSIRF